MQRSTFLRALAGAGLAFPGAGALAAGTSSTATTSSAKKAPQAPAAPASSAAEEEERIKGTLLAIEDMRQDAVRNRNVGSLGQIYAAEFVGVTITGAIVDRTQLIQLFARGNAAQRVETDELRVQVHGDTAIVFGRQTSYAPTGDVTFTNRFSNVYLRREARWQCISGQSTPIVV